MHKQNVAYYGILLISTILYTGEEVVCKGDEAIGGETTVHEITSGLVIESWDHDIVVVVEVMGLE